jgi:hypothetical protein
MTPRPKDTLDALRVATQSICMPPRQTAHPQAKNLQDPAKPRPAAPSAPKTTPYN